jgi:hypothetical protein
MAKPRLLTKTRFKTGCECPTKLFFTGKNEYGNNNKDNAFLKALAEGGFQVGELAKAYHPGGVEIDTLNVDDSVRQTADLLKQECVTLYEPAFQVGDLLVRVDILVKRGNQVELIEVKAKSYDPTESHVFLNRTLLKKGIEKLSTDWEPYILDVAFQGYVLKAAHPKWEITHFLMLADKKAVATADGINQCFLLEIGDDGRSRAVTKAGLERSELGAPLLARIEVEREVGLARTMTFSEGRSFEEQVTFLSNAWKSDKMVTPTVSTSCKGCEFRISTEKVASGPKSGFQECWSIAQALKPADFDKPFVFDLWNFRKAQALIDDGRIFIEDIKKTDINPSQKSEPGLSSTERQWLQVERELERNALPYCDNEGLEAEFSKFRFPLNFIDFETTMAAIPFHKGRRPYEQIAFQFSHHIIHSDGTIEHANQYLHNERGKFPNFDFVRALRHALGDGGGTIFRFAAHENTVLCQIRDQLKRSDEADRPELISWIETVTHSKIGEDDGWVGPRNMVDLCELVKKYYYHPKTGGSNSIKKVLPAILNSASDLQKQYASAAYGSKGGIKSLNFKDWTWIQRDANGNLIDPYKLLPQVFSDLDLETMDSLITDSSLADGGAAMTAYARMQFTEMSDVERERVSAALLKYCELDTFAMVLIYQYWKSILDQNKGKEAA